MACDLRLRFQSSEQFSSLAERAAALGLGVIAADVSLRLPPASPSEASAEAARKGDDPCFASAMAQRLASASKTGRSFAHPLCVPVPLENPSLAEREDGGERHVSSLHWLNPSQSRLLSHFKATTKTDAGLVSADASGGSGCLSSLSQWIDLFPYAVNASTAMRSRLGFPKTAKSLLQLRRVTVELHSTSAAASLSSLFPKNPPFVAKQQLTSVSFSSPNSPHSTQSGVTSGEDLPSCVEILAVRPTDPATWDFCCSSCQCDIIALDFSATSSSDAGSGGTGKLPFTIRRKHVLQAARRGVFFELSLSDLLPKRLGKQGGTCFSKAAVNAHLDSESDRCRNVWTNMQKILRFAPPKQILISSGAVLPHDVRPPAEVAAIGAVLGVCTVENARKAGGSGVAFSVLSKAAAEHACGGAVNQGWPLKVVEASSEETQNMESLLSEVAKRTGMPPSIAQQLELVRKQLLHL